MRDGTIAPGGETLAGTARTPDSAQPTTDSQQHERIDNCRNREPGTDEPISEHSRYRHNS